MTHHRLETIINRSDQYEVAKARATLAVRLRHLGEDLMTILFR